MAIDWLQRQTDRDIARLGERIDRIEQAMREEKDRRFQRTTRILSAILWLEIAAIWAIGIAKSAGAF
jgi:hypothetical protein